MTASAVQRPARRRRLRLLVTGGIGLLATVVAVLAGVLPGIGGLVSAADEVPYDRLFRLRSPRERPDAPVVLVEVDDAALDKAERTDAGELAQQWPWDRGLWGAMVGYFQQQGARAVVFDIHFTGPAVRGAEEDERFAQALDAATVPVVISGGDDRHRFAPPTTRPVPLGDVTFMGDTAYRVYTPDTPRGPSLALAAVRAAGLEAKLPVDRPFRVLYHGPSRWGDGRSVYPAYSAAWVAFAALGKTDAFPPDTFRGKIVVIGATAAGLGDVKTVPVDDKYPGVEFHATAIDNLLSGQSVRIAPLRTRVALAFLLAMMAAGGVIGVRTLAAKVGVIVATSVLLVAAAVGPMLLPEPVWFAPAVPAIALVLAVVTALIFTYRIEDARARVLLRALGQCVSPYVAAELAEDPQCLVVGGRQRQMTVLFSDIAGFTSLAERLAERIEPVLNFYLAEMSQRALATDGTIDKYIGDAMMVFWNAPLDQADHAARACRAALDIAAHERAIAPRLAELGAAGLHTRIGINTGPVVVGFFGSDRRLSYTAIGDAVNLAARLEPSNKTYGTQILVSEFTRRLAGDAFVFRRVDRLRVYGRNEPAEVYELLAERAGAETGVETGVAWLAETFDGAMDRYFAQSWDAADATLGTILARYPSDGPSLLLRQRIGQFRERPPGPDWDGVYTATGK